jgi:hypothetical protein
MTNLTVIFFKLSEAVLGDEAGEMREGPVVCSLRIIGKAAGGKFPVL